MVISIMFEVLEYTLEHQLPNFSECWWDHVSIPPAVYYVHPLGGGHVIFAFSGVRRHTWFPDILGNSSYPIFTKFGMQVYWVNTLYWVNSLYGIAFGDDSSIAN